MLIFWSYAHQSKAILDLEAQLRPEVPIVFVLVDSSANMGDGAYYRSSLSICRSPNSEVNYTVRMGW
jgi:hypothetical protein